jgi:hypothetical protein
MNRPNTAELNWKNAIVKSLGNQNASRTKGIEKYAVTLRRKRNFGEKGKSENTCRI